MKVYINNHKLAEELGASYTNEVIKDLQIIQTLIRRFGKKLRSDHLQEILEKEYPNIISLIQFLLKFDKLTTEDTKDLISLIKKKYDHTTIFDVYSSSEEKNEDMEEYLQKNYKAKANMLKTEKVGVRIQGEGIYYERNIDKDIKKLLQ